MRWYSEHEFIPLLPQLRSGHEKGEIMKILAVIAIILAMITGLGIMCCVWVIAWLGFESTEIGQAITDKVKEKLGK